MRKLFSILLIALTALSVVGLGVYRHLAARSVGGESPVITFDQNVLEVTTDATEEELMQGVTATDAEDGDVTVWINVLKMLDKIEQSNLRLRDILVSDKTVEVTYAAFDSQGHVTKAARSVRYVNYKAPRFYLTGPMVFSEAGVSELLSYVGARDCIDGDISSRVKVSAAESASLLSTPGMHMLEFRVTNSSGDTAYLTLGVEVVSGYSSSQKIKLTDYLVYLPVGAEFDPKAYLAADEEAQRDLKIDHQVDTAVPGVYDVHYTLGSSMTRLIVVVTEKG